MMILHTDLDHVKIIENKIFEDQRGLFVKTFHQEIFREHGLESDFRESFYSVSKQGVLRGMHFQLPPYDHSKLVYVPHGEILDVAVDIRPKSPTFGRYVSCQLSDSNAKALYIGRGFAHGFLTLSTSATVVYLTSTVHQPSADTGIRWDSFGFDWGISAPVMSQRDILFKGLEALS